MRRMRRRMRMMRMVMIMMRMIILRIIITMVLASRWESGNNGPSHLLIFTSNMNIRGKLRCAGSSTCFYILCLLLLLCLSSRDL